jgi:hypothetical protein
MDATPRIAARPIHAILVHGMGRTPLSMALLARRLDAAGMATKLFGYVAMVEGFAACRDRLQRVVDQETADAPAILIGHSLGTVLIRAACPQLRRPPFGGFLLAPPSRASRAARAVAPRRLFRLLTGEMGQLLADADFMNALPLPTAPTTVYAGTGGPRGSWSPFAGEPNDGVLAVAETQLPGAPTRLVPAIHTFIMNSRDVAEDIVRTTGELAARACHDL